MWRRLLFSVLPFLGLTLLLSGCRQPVEVWPETGKVRVLASFPPLYCFAANVAGEDADVRCLLTSKGPHDYHPNHNDVQFARSADILLMNGLDLDEFLGKLLGKNSKTQVVRVGDALPHEVLLHADHAHEHEGHKHGVHDPHVWLSPVLAKEMVQQIAQKLAARKPSLAANFTRRADEYIKKLDDLQAFGDKVLEGKQNRRLISTHESLGYFAAAFKLEVVGALQKAPGVEGHPKNLTELTELAIKKKVAVVAVEPQYSHRQGELLQKEVIKGGGSMAVVEIDPLETAPAASGSVNPSPDHYLQGMRRNLENLAKALP